mmetsp:Transcript_10491/g.20269  ORF Transcript_10491/g.20269 Transcript_10491/m.20269 type:complete len:142 (+) Transcript_10491:172-597(+)
MRCAHRYPRRRARRHTTTRLRTDTTMSVHVRACTDMRANVRSPQQVLNTLRAPARRCTSNAKHAFAHTHARPLPHIAFPPHFLLPPHACTEQVRSCMSSRGVLEYFQQKIIVLLQRQAIQKKHTAEDSARYSAAEAHSFTG